jgi:hypothetical protein
MVSVLYVIVFAVLRAVVASLLATKADRGAADPGMR